MNDLHESSLAIGRLQAAQEATDKRVESVETKVDTIDSKLDKLLAMHEQRKGERRVVAVIASAVGSGIGLAVGWFHK